MFPGYSQSIHLKPLLWRKQYPNHYHQPHRRRPHSPSCSGCCPLLSEKLYKPPHPSSKLLPFQFSSPTRSILRKSPDNNLDFLLHHTSSLTLSFTKPFTTSPTEICQVLVLAISNNLITHSSLKRSWLPTVVLPTRPRAWPIWPTLTAPALNPDL